MVSGVLPLTEHLFRTGVKTANFTQFTKLSLSFSPGSDDQFYIPSATLLNREQLAPLCQDLLNILVTLHKILKSTIRFVTGSIVRNCSLTMETKCFSITCSSKSASQADELGRECTFVDNLIIIYQIIIYRSRIRQIVVVELEIKNYREFTIVIWY